MYNITTAAVLHHDGGGLAMTVERNIWLLL